jgi:hypothetical protein
MTNQFPDATKMVPLPPHELVHQWSVSSPIQYSEELWAYELFIAHQAARWGSDQELEACCAWLDKEIGPVDSCDLRADRRPNPPSLKELALTALHAVAIGVNDTREQHQDLDTIRRALEALPND